MVGMGGDLHGLPECLYDVAAGSPGLNKSERQREYAKKEAAVSFNLLRVTYHHFCSILFSMSNPNSGESITLIHEYHEVRIRKIILESGYYRIPL